MPVLHLDNIPDELFRRIEQLAEADRMPLAEETVHLLQQAVAFKQARGGAGAPPPVRSQREVLDDISRLRWAPPPGSPGVVEMLREDRER
jgi:hypothetical protein